MAFNEYLTLQFYKAAVNKEFDLWDSTLKQVIEVNKYPTLPISHWMAQIYIKNSDLVMFCQSRGISVNFEVNDDETSSRNIIDELEQKNSNATIDCPTTLLEELTSPASDHIEQPSPEDNQLKQTLSIMNQDEVLPKSQIQAEITKLTTPQISDTGIKNKRKNVSVSNTHHFDDLSDDAYVPIKVVATLLGCSESTIVRRVKNGMLPSPKRFGERDTRWNVGALREMLRKDS
jgi:predicted DNA-binding transcriptional regulator AlpA